MSMLGLARAGQILASGQGPFVAVGALPAARAPQGDVVKPARLCSTLTMGAAAGAARPEEPLACSPT
jgi:hypothetical protein